MFYVGDEVLWVFEADAEADEACAVLGDNARIPGVGHDDGGCASPGVAELEEFERVDEGFYLFFCDGLAEDEGEEAYGAGEVAQKVLVARA